MPGKVNPIMPELINQLYYIVSGNNLTIEHCVEASQLELGVMLPVINDRLLQSLKIIIDVTDQFTNLCVKGIKADRARCKWILENSSAYATMLSSKLGYDVISKVVKESLKTNKTVKQVVLEKKLLTNKEFDNLIK